MLGGRVQEFGSEIEDMLSSEITIDRFYTKEMQNFSSSPKQHMILDESVANLFIQFANPLGPDDIDLGNSLVLYAQKAIYTSYQKFLLTNEFQSTQLLLRGVSAAIEQKVNNKTIKEILQFEIRRAQAMGYYKESKFSNAIKQLNPAVSSGPVIGGSFSSGLSDALVLLADCYSALGRRDDALRSAKLAVNIAHERLDRANKNPNFTIVNKDVLSYEGPVLDAVISVIVSYCSLASELEKSGLGRDSIEWYQRALHAAIRFQLDKSTIQELQKLIDLSKVYAPSQPKSPHAASQQKPSNNGNASNSRPVRDVAASPSRIVQPDQVDGWFIREEIQPSSSSQRPRQEDNSAPPTYGDNSLSGKARPRSALPRLFNDRPINDQTRMTDDNNLNTGRDSNEAKRNETSYRPFSSNPNQSSNNGSSQNNHNGMSSSNNHNNNDGSHRFIETSLAELESMRPKSALSKLGESYNAATSNNHNISNNHINNNNLRVVIAPVQEIRQDRNIEPSNNSNVYRTYPYQAASPLILNNNYIAGNQSPERMRQTTPMIQLPPSHFQQQQYQQQPSRTQVQQPPASPALATHSLISAHSIILLPSPGKAEEAGNTKNGNSKADRKKRRGNKSPNRPLSRSQSAHPTTGHNTHDQQVIPLAKTNKTTLSKAIQHQDEEKKKVANPVQPGISVPQGYLDIDEFGKDRIKRISDLYIPYFKGLKVEARYQVTRLGENGRWYPGRIVKADFIHGLYDVEFENGDREQNIFVDDIRIPEYASKQSLLKASQSVKTLPRKRPDEEVKKNQGAKVNARLIRKQNNDEMHASVMKMLAGINQRSDIRKIERIEMKNEVLAKFQAKVRGILTRLRFPKIVQQLIRENELRKREDEIKRLEEALKQANVLGASSSGAGGSDSKKATVTFAEVQTGYSLIEDTMDMANGEVADLMRADSLDPSNGFMSNNQNMGMNPYFQTTSNDYFYPYELQTSQQSPSSTPLHYQQQQQMYMGAPNVGVDYMQEVLANVQEEQRSWREYERMKTNTFVQEVHQLKDALLSQREEFLKLQKREELKRRHLEQQLQDMLMITQANEILFQRSTSMSPTFATTQNYETSPVPTLSNRKFSPEKRKNDAPMDETRMQTRPRPASSTKTQPRHENTVNIIAEPVVIIVNDDPEDDDFVQQPSTFMTGEGEVGMSVYVPEAEDDDLDMDNLPLPIELQEGTMQESNTFANQLSEFGTNISFEMESLTHQPHNFHENEPQPQYQENSLDEFGEVRIEEFWNSISSAEFPATYRPADHQRPESDEKNIGASIVDGAVTPINPEFLASSFIGDSLLEKDSPSEIFPTESSPELSLVQPAKNIQEIKEAPKLPEAPSVEAIKKPEVKVAQAPVTQAPEATPAKELPKAVEKVDPPNTLTQAKFEQDLADVDDASLFKDIEDDKESKQESKQDSKVVTNWASEEPSLELKTHSGVFPEISVTLSVAEEEFENLNSQIQNIEDALNIGNAATVLKKVLGDFTPRNEVVAKPTPNEPPIQVHAMAMSLIHNVVHNGVKSETVRHTIISKPSSAALLPVQPQPEIVEIKPQSQEVVDSPVESNDIHDYMKLSPKSSVINILQNKSKEVEGTSLHSTVTPSNHQFAVAWSVLCTNHIVTTIKSSSQMIPCLASRSKGDQSLQIYLMPQSLLDHPEDIHINFFGAGIKLGSRIIHASNVKEIQSSGNWKIVEINQFNPHCQVRSSIISIAKLQSSISKLWEAHLDWVLQQLFIFAAMTELTEKSIVGLKTANTRVPQTEVLHQEYSNLLMDLAFNSDEDDKAEEGNDVLLRDLLSNAVNELPDEDEADNPSYPSNKYSATSPNKKSSHELILKKIDSILAMPTEDAANAWIQKFTDYLQHGRDLHRESMESVQDIEFFVGNEILRKWEFDIRRQHSSISGGGLDDTKPTDTDYEVDEYGVTYPERDLSTEMKVLANAIYQQYRQVIDEHNSEESSEDIANKIVHIVEKLWHEDWSMQLEQILIRFLEGVHVADYKKEILPPLLDELYLSLRQNLNLIGKYSWSQYFKSRTSCRALIASQQLDQVLHTAQQIMFSKASTSSYTSPREDAPEQLIEYVKNIASPSKA